MKLCFATNNAHKLEEVQDLLGESFLLTTLREIGCVEEIPETHDTIPENSFEKAEYIWEKYGINCFADDSGLEVDTLSGEPGVHSAYYGGPERDANLNMDVLLKNLEGHKDLSARFICVITLVIAGEYRQFEGVIEGTISREKQGNHGFGYNPIFIPEGHDRTFAEMTMQEKSELSHRGRAFEKLKQYLLTL